MNIRPLLVATLALVYLSGCAKVMYSVQGDKPIEESDSRTFGEVIDDNALETQIKVAILQSDERLHDARVRVFSYNGKVLIVGQVPTEELKTKVTEAAKILSKVKSIHNELSIGENISVNVRASDSWLATKVKSRMFTTDNFPSRKIDIITENGVIFLMGIIDTSTGTLAGKIASEVNGVQKVVTLFEQP